MRSRSATRACFVRLIVGFLGVGLLVLKFRGTHIVAKCLLAHIGLVLIAIISIA